MKSVSLKSLLIVGVVAIAAAAIYLHFAEQEVAHLSIEGEQEAVNPGQSNKEVVSVAEKATAEQVLANKLTAPAQQQTNENSASQRDVPVEQMQNTTNFNAAGAGTPMQKANAAEAAVQAYKQAQEQGR